MTHPARLATAAILGATLLVPLPPEASADDGLRTVPLRSRVERVQPLTGIVLWATNERNRTDAIQLEFSYLRYADVVRGRGEYDWSAVDRLLGEIAGRGHQAILRFYDAYPGKPTPMPAYLRDEPGYRVTRGPSEGKPTEFPDWSHPEQRRFHLEFYGRFAERFDADPRLAYLQVGFGLWSEYHIYDGPMELGRTFPSKAFQAEFLRHMAREFRRTPWMISIDAAEGERTPLAAEPALLDLTFGLFDDSLLNEDREGYNARGWAFFGPDRWTKGPCGGEFSYYTDRDQRLALAPDGPHGVAFERAAAERHLTFVIGDAQPRYQAPERIRAAGLACGYRFRVVEFASGPGRSRVIIANEGVAPIYHDAHPSVDGTRAAGSLKGLLPGDRRTFEVPAGGPAPRLTIESDRLVPGQAIGFAADL